MSPKFAHSSESVYLFPISHANKFHNLLYDDINLHDSARLSRHCERIGSHCAWLGYEIGGSRHCDWLVCHCAGLVSQRIMKSAHILAEYTIRTIDDIATTVGSVSFAKSTCNALITASIHAASRLLVAMFDATSSSLSKVQARSWLRTCHPPCVKQNLPEPFELTRWVHPLYWYHPGNNNWSMTYYW